MTLNLPHLLGLYSSAPGSGKTTVAAHLAATYGYEILPLAQPLKTTALTFLACLGVPVHKARDYVYSDKNSIIPEIGVSSRHLLQTLGTEWGRQCIHPEIWLRAWESALGHLPAGSRIVVDDIRFMNEADFIQNTHCGLIWRLDRPTATRPNSHASEGDLDDFTDFDAHLHNTGTLDDLRSAVDALLTA